MTSLVFTVTINSRVLRHAESNISHDKIYFRSYFRSFHMNYRPLSKGKLQKRRHQRFLTTFVCMLATQQRIRKC